MGISPSRKDLIAMPGQTLSTHETNMHARIYNRENQAPANGWFQIEVSGTHLTGDGRRQVIDEVALQSILNRFQAEAMHEHFAGILVDADHLSHDLENPTAALAWLKELDIRNGQLHGRLELTDLGDAAVKGRRYKWFSTEYNAADLQPLPDNGVRPLRLAGLAFTNRPNNRGGKPISNRAEDPSGEPEKQTHHIQTTMKPIAEKLGLSAEATEADILTAISSLLSRVAEMETKDATTEADAIMNRLGSRVPEAARPHWRSQLILNRAQTEPLMEASFPLLPAEARIFNRSAATPAVAAIKTDEEKSTAQKSVVTSIRNRDRCSFEAAWTIAKGERPEQATRHRIRKMAYPTADSDDLHDP